MTVHPQDFRVDVYSGGTGIVAQWAIRVTCGICGWTRTDASPGSQLAARQRLMAEHVEHEAQGRGRPELPMDAT